MPLRTDLAIAQLPLPAPNVGGLLGKNTVYTDPAFGTKVVRLTDGSSGSGNFSSMQTNGDPSGYPIWNTDDTLMMCRNNGGNSFLFQFNPSTLQGTQLGTAFPYKLSGVSCFSQVTKGVLYNAPGGGTVLNALTFALIGGVWTYQSTAVVCDFANILPAGFDVIWQSDLTISLSDAVFSLAFSAAGAQDTGFNACLFKPGSGPGTGYRMINTQTLAVTGQWGLIGTATLEHTAFENFLLHGVNQSPNPAFTTLSPVHGSSLGTFVWPNAGLVLTQSGESGHHGLGYLSAYTGGPGRGQYAGFTYAAPTVHTLVIPKQAGPPGLPAYNLQYPGGPEQVYKGDQHSAFGPRSLTDAALLWITNGPPVTNPFTSCWYGELRGLDVTGAISGQQGTVYRAAHTRNSGRSTQYIVTSAQVAPSQTGKFVAFTSDFAGDGNVGPLGSTSGAATGTVGVDARGDVFVVAIALVSPFSVTTAALAGGTVGSAYSQTLQAAGGSSPYTWAITAGSLPAGLSLNASTGVISGTLNGSGSFTVTATDSTAPTPLVASANLSITASSGVQPLNVTTSGVLPPGTANSPYVGATLHATGGVTPYTWAITAGALPAGLSLNAATGAISGTPTAAGLANFTATATDAETPTPQTASSSFSIAIAAVPALVVTTDSLPGGLLGSAFSQTLAATGGTAPYTWSVTAGASGAPTPQTSSASLSVALLAPGELYDITDIDNPGLANHHIEVWAQVIVS
jgi:hypothetical protein